MKKFLASIALMSTLFLLSSAVISTPASALIIFACNSTGDVKNTFYTNESVYVTGNVTEPDQDVDIYIVRHRTSWPNGTAIVPLGYKMVKTNSSGGIPVTTLWDTPDVGNYDVVADVNSDEIFNNSIDAVDNTTTAGFTVLQAPIPTLTVELGDYHPSSHDCDLEVDIGHNVMMQVNITASTKEDVRIESAAITSFGSGDDKDDIKVVYFVYDINDDGKYNSTKDVLLGYGSYTRDEGVVFFDIQDGFIIPAGGARTFVVTYMMDTSGSVDDTYRFDLITMTAYGASSDDTAVINGLPLGSAVKTISHAAPTTTTTTTTVPFDNVTNETTTTTTIPADECQTDADCPGISCSEKKKTNYRCTYDTAKDANVCAAIIVSVQCCGDADCVEKYYCLNYECVKERAGGLFGWLGSLWGRGKGKVNIWTIVSIVVVAIGVIVVFFLIKNRRRRTWRTKKEYEERWESLREKWEGK